MRAVFHLTHSVVAGITYEESIRIPTILPVPGQTGKNIKAIELQDLAQTILDIAGIKIPDYMHGHSWLDLLSDQSINRRDDYYVEAERRKKRTFQRTLWTEEWKLVFGCPPNTI